MLTLGVFWPVKNCQFINYDDPEYVTSNPHLEQRLTPAAVRWAFTAGYADNWHPLTWLSHLLDVELFGLKPDYPKARTNLAAAKREAQTPKGATQE